VEMPRVERGILKLSGELFADEKLSISFNQYEVVARSVLEIKHDTGIQLAIVVGGGNIFRGRQAASKVDKSEADSMGMLATITNGIGLREAFNRAGDEDEVRLMTAIAMPEIGEPYIRMKARHHLKTGKIVILSGGLGKPGFSTDSAVAQYADELQCEMIFKASTVDGVYDSDPKTNPKAKKYDNITPEMALRKKLKVMDNTAFAMVENSGIPIFVFDISDLARLPEAIRGGYSFGTLVRK